ncbi:VOC family protein [Novosphingobium sp. ES2-1]|uniref:VOC family protein n=1 Tax=Novosphingobium sp. ES2-1 TaxID=2780074 RepID=UPI00188123DD|nr:VOC family protein [Novosphingobium sp. ES2-1]QOV94535.1 VOC family protein [Novosphingobium sp. ES2-1]
MPSARLEHVNISVSDAERSAAFFTELCGWHERWRGLAIDDGFSIHLGTENHYIVFYTPPGGVSTRFAKGMPLQHVGIEVDDLVAAEQIVIAAGLEPFNHADYEPGRRFYFYDWDGIEFEVVSYGD